MLVGQIILKRMVHSNNAEVSPWHRRLQRSALSQSRRLAYNGLGCPHLPPPPAVEFSSNRDHVAVQHIEMHRTAKLNATLRRSCWTLYRSFCTLVTYSSK